MVRDVGMAPVVITHPFPFSQSCRMVAMKLVAVELRGGPNAVCVDQID